MYVKIIWGRKSGEVKKIKERDKVRRNKREGVGKEEKNSRERNGEERERRKEKNGEEGKSRRKTFKESGVKYRPMVEWNGQCKKG